MTKFCEIQIVFREIQKVFREILAKSLSEIKLLFRPISYFAKSQKTHFVTTIGAGTDNVSA